MTEGSTLARGASWRTMFSTFLDDYRPKPGIADELFGPDGDIRPVWRPLISALARMSAEELQQRMSRADLYLRDSGVFYRQYDQGDTGERDWPLSHVPVLIAEEEWTQIIAGLRERADLLEAVLADIYGDNRLVAEGHLPAALISSNPEWLRPLVGIKPRTGHFLHFVAFDIGRGPQGKWWVLGDRTQAPSGIGFSLENRIATRRAFPEIYQHSNVHRLAGFFQQFRATLEGMKADPKNLVGILTPGQFNESYYEHAYIARYLGLLLVEGEDLVVRDSQLMLRTIEGLHPIDVLWRRLDAKWADPLELDETSYLGTGGLVGATRDHAVAVVNALGSGVAETRAFQAFLPKLQRVLRGSDLKLPNVATWWCGQAAERAFVKQHADELVLGNAFSTRMPSGFDLRKFAGGDEGADFETLIDRHGTRLVAQETVTLSTTPALVGGKLVQRPMNLRVYLARTEQGWKAMPGGFARVAREEGATNLTLQHGGAVSDVWIVSPKPVAEQTLLGSGTDATNGIALPSRQADNLFWLGRYVERAENGFRLMRAFHYRLAESGRSATPELDQIAEFLESLDIVVEKPLPQGVVDAVQAARSSAGHVRDRFSTDGWLALNDLANTVNKFKAKITAGDDAARAMSVLLRKTAGFAGLVHENMYHFTGWRFLIIGWALERAIFMAGMLPVFAAKDASSTELEFALEVGDSTMAHRRRFGAAITHESVTHILGLDPLNPRSVLRQLTQIAEHLRYLPGSSEHKPSPLQKAALEMQTELTVKSASDIDWSDLAQGVMQLSLDLTSTYLK